MKRMSSKSTLLETKKTNLSNDIKRLNKRDLMKFNSSSKRLQSSKEYIEIETKQQQSIDKLNTEINLLKVETLKMENENRRMLAQLYTMDEKDTSLIKERDALKAKIDWKSKKDCKSNENLKEKLTELWEDNEMLAERRQNFTQRIAELNSIINEENLKIKNILYQSEKYNEAIKKSELECRAHLLKCDDKTKWEEIKDVLKKFEIKKKDLEDIKKENMNLKLKFADVLARSLNDSKNSNADENIAVVIDDKLTKRERKFELVFWGAVIFSFLILSYALGTIQSDHYNKEFFYFPEYDDNLDN